LSGNFFDGPYFEGGFFGANSAPAVEEVVRGGKGDNEKRRRRLNVFKPTGLPVTSRKPQDVDQRVADTRDIAAEIEREAGARESLHLEPVTQMSLADIDREIKALMQVQMRTQEEEAMLLILLAAYS
jgi:hypothetical protein